MPPRRRKRGNTKRQAPLQLPSPATSGDVTRTPPPTPAPTSGSDSGSSSTRRRRIPTNAPIYALHEIIKVKVTTIAHWKSQADEPTKTGRLRSGLSSIWLTARVVEILKYPMLKLEYIDEELPVLSHTATGRFEIVAGDSSRLRSCSDLELQEWQAITKEESPMAVEFDTTEHTEAKAIEVSSIKTEPKSAASQVIKRVKRKRRKFPIVKPKRQRKNVQIAPRLSRAQMEQKTVTNPCSHCKQLIQQYKFVCYYCEKDKTVPEYSLCLTCFETLPQHNHPRSSFAQMLVLPSDATPISQWPESNARSKIVLVFAVDSLVDVSEKTEKGEPTASVGGQDKVASCCFCRSDDWSTNGGVLENKAIEIGPLLPSKANVPTALVRHRKHKYAPDQLEAIRKRARRKDRYGLLTRPDFSALKRKRGVAMKRQLIYAHLNCAKYTPGIVQCPIEGTWYNIASTYKRCKRVKCHGCGRVGASIGCFARDCTRSFHLRCTGMPLAYFERRAVFWCKEHREQDWDAWDRNYMGIEDQLASRVLYEDYYKCDGCGVSLDDVNDFWTCKECQETDYFDSFDLCGSCNESKFEHEHERSSFITRSSAKDVFGGAFKKKDRLKSTSRPSIAKDVQICRYCLTTGAIEWRVAFGRVALCVQCYDAAIAIEGCGLDGYTFNSYLTRRSIDGPRQGQQLLVPTPVRTLDPIPADMWSVGLRSTHYDLVDKVPRWATHNGMDWQGGWLQQTARQAILRHTEAREVILSNFLGSGTDAVEGFLLGRRVIGMDINPTAVTLAQKNCAFGSTESRRLDATMRPTIFQGDARMLAFKDDTFDHALSHLPYRNCIRYSSDIEGDMSHHRKTGDFLAEVRKVVGETMRVLKGGRRVTVGIGDNRENNFILPISFQVLRAYIDGGFELEEIIVKRQRYCAGGGLGHFLSKQYDFLQFDYEYIATLRNRKGKEAESYVMSYGTPTLGIVAIQSGLYGVPAENTAEDDHTGSTWVLPNVGTASLAELATAKAVSKFGYHAVQGDNIEVYWYQESWQAPRAETSDEPCILTYLRMIEGTPCKMTPGLPLVVIPHVEFPELSSAASLSRLNAYRGWILDCISQATPFLSPGGMIVVGSMDYRDAEGRFWPLTMLIQEDVLGHEVNDRGDSFSLKEEVIVVPDGYQSTRKDGPESAVIHARLPIVHAIYHCLRVRE